MWYWSADTLFWQPKFLGCIDNEILLPMVLCYQLTLSGFKKLPTITSPLWNFYSSGRETLISIFFQSWRKSVQKHDSILVATLCPHDCTYNFTTGFVSSFTALLFVLKGLMYVLPFSFIVPLFEQTTVCPWSVELSASRKAHPVLFLQERLPLCYWGE